MTAPCCTGVCHDGPGCYWHGPHPRHQAIGVEDPRSPAEREMHRIMAGAFDRDGWGVNEDGWW